MLNSEPYRTKMDHGQQTRITGTHTAMRDTVPLRQIHAIQLTTERCSTVLITPDGHTQVFSARWLSQS